MKKILVIGEHSYIGTAFQRYVRIKGKNMEVTLAGARNGAWRNVDLGCYDAVFHAAGKAHADTGRVNDAVKREYYRVNHKLAVEAARAARKAGTRQFIYPSSIIIYGDSVPCGGRKVITGDTEPSPADFYGDSKHKADQAIRGMDSESFHTAVLRLPMVYGRGSKGNYPFLSRMARRLPVFPDIPNERSMLYIGNLCEFLCEIIENGENGVFYPQNAEYVNTAEMLQMIAEGAGRDVRLSAVLNPLVGAVGRMPGKIGQMANKAFGSLVYEKSLSEYRGNRYQVYGLEESIRRTEGY